MCQVSRQSTLLHTQVYKERELTATAVLPVVAGAEGALGVITVLEKENVTGPKMWAMVQETRHTVTWVDPSPQR